MRSNLKACCILQASSASQHSSDCVSSDQPRITLLLLETAPRIVACTVFAFKHVTTRSSSDFVQAQPCLKECPPDA